MKYIEFDASKIDGYDAYFCWHVRNPGVGGCWASKENAQMYALVEKQPTGLGGYNWFSHASKAQWPLYFVARVVEIAEAVGPWRSDKDGNYVVVEADYGSDRMRGLSGGPFALRSKPDAAGIRLFDDDDEYAELVGKGEEFYDETEAMIDAKVAERRAEEFEGMEAFAEAIVDRHGKLTTEPPYLRIDTVVTDDGVECVKLEALNLERFEFHGFGTFMMDIQPGEVEITETAIDYIRRANRGRDDLKNVSATDTMINWMMRTPVKLAPVDHDDAFGIDVENLDAEWVKVGTVKG